MFQHLQTRFLLLSCFLDSKAFDGLAREVIGFEVFRCRHVGNDKHHRVNGISVANGCSAKKLVAPFKIHCLALLLHHHFKIPTDTFAIVCPSLPIFIAQICTSEEHGTMNALIAVHPVAGH